MVVNAGVRGQQRLQPTANKREVRTTPIITTHALTHDQTAPRTLTCHNRTINNERISTATSGEAVLSMPPAQTAVRSMHDLQIDRQEAR